MKIFQISYPIKNSETKIKIFNHNFTLKIRNKCKVIYKNKIYPFNNEFEIEDETNKVLKIKLICYFNIYDINNIKNECESPIQFKEINNKKRNNIFTEFSKLSVHDMSTIIYKIPKNEDSIIKIFGENFVKNNKDKYIIIYKNKIFPLKEYFSIKEMDKGDKKLEIQLI